MVSDIDSWPAEVEDLTAEEAPAGKGRALNLTRYVREKQSGFRTSAQGLPAGQRF